MLEVLEGEAPGEPMKPLSEFAEGLRKIRGHPQGNQIAPFHRGFDAGMFRAADLLQAWLREADAWLSDPNKQGLEGWVDCRVARRVLLGTTRTEGKK